jgi:diaminohydroxyphosphoribosylaminopyrimidine deaminase/5-amino-6-(5-phosphoribosylamino)uracil reductase
VTGPEARQFAHILRARARCHPGRPQNGRRCNPELTCRLPAWQAAPARVILDAKFRTLAYREDVPDSRARAGDDLRRHQEHAPSYPKGAEVRRMPGGPDGRLSLAVALESLAAEGVTRVLVEGGPTITSAFLAATSSTRS